MADRDSAATPIQITVRYYAAARGAAGATEERLHLPPAATVADVIALAVHEHGPKLGAVIARCSFLLDETAVRDGSTPVGPGSVIDVLPPFAGGNASGQPPEHRERPTVVSGITARPDRLRASGRPTVDPKVTV